MTPNVSHSLEMSSSGGEAREEETKSSSVERSQNQHGKKHLVVLVHGLFGSDKHLVNVVKLMESNFSKNNDVFVYVSKANKRTKTLDGIHECGERLIEELKDLVSSSGLKAELKTISLVGHSLGGLISRYAVGHAYDKDTKTVFGLEPLHFITICTPHFGCNDTYMTDIKKEDSVTPCLRWPSSVPVIGKLPAFLFHVFEEFFVGLVLRRTGKQLFLRDDNPIILRMAADGSDTRSEIQFERRGSAPKDTKKKSKRKSKRKSKEPPREDDDVPYLTALSSFKERTCYGNIRGDHVVAWENATIRRKCDLPKISRKAAPYGIVNEEVSPASPPEGPCLTPTLSMATCPKIEVMIKNLEALGWRRVDVKTKILLHKNAPWAHDNIISKKDAHDNFKVVALHSSALIVESIRRYSNLEA